MAHYDITLKILYLCCWLVDVEPKLNLWYLCVFVDPEQAKLLLLPAYERLLSKHLREVFTDNRAHTIDDFMTGT